MADELSLLAANAVQRVADGSRIGLGTGHTVDAFLESLARRVAQGLRVRGVPTSEATARRARALGIPLDTLDPAEPLELTIDGADEVERGTLNLIKGWGGALVRERVVAAASRRQIILVTGEKVVDRLGDRGKLPVEVIPFAAPFCRRRIEQLAGFGRLRPVLREENGQPFTSDNGNWIFDCGIERQSDPAGLARALCAIPGVVDTGLFIGTASAVLVAEAGSVRELHRANGP